MSVQVAPDLEAMIRAKVDAGRYDDTDDVLREALRALDEQERLRDLRASLIRANEQIDRGEYVEWSPDLMEQLDRRADEAERQGRKPKADVRP